jgi:hypothetical protein
MPLLKVRSYGAPVSSYGTQISLYGVNHELTALLVGYEQPLVPPQLTHL